MVPEGNSSNVDALAVDKEVAGAKELMMIELKEIFSKAIKMVVDRGYDQKMVEMAISRKSIYSEGDLIKKIASDTILNLKGEGSETTVDIVFPNLQKLLEYTLDEMIRTHHKKRPSITLINAISELRSDLIDALASFGRDKLRCVLSSEQRVEKNEQISKLLDRAQELQVEVEKWNRWENLKVKQVADKLRIYQTDTEVLERITEAYRKNGKLGRRMN